MVWVKVDDHFDEHPKLANVGPLGWALWLAGLAYCNRNQTDGVIPWRVARSLVSWEYLGPETEERERPHCQVSVTTDEGALEVTSARIIELLVSAGVWESVEGGYYVHDYADYQPTRAELDEQREAKRLAGRAGGRASAQARWSGSKLPIKAPATAPAQAPAEAPATADAQAPATAPATADAQAKSNPVPGTRYPVPDPDPVPHPDPGTQVRDSISPGVRGADAPPRAGVNGTANQGATTRARRRTLPPVPVAVIEELVGEYAPQLGDANAVRLAIDRALNNRARFGAINDVDYLRLWLRDDVRKREERPNANRQYAASRVPLPAIAGGPRDTRGAMAERLAQLGPPDPTRARLAGVRGDHDPGSLAR